MVFKKKIFTNIKIYLECIIELRIKKTVLESISSTSREIRVKLVLTW